MGGKFMIKIDDEKWAKLPKMSDRLAETYGPVGSPSRQEFEAKAEEVDSAATCHAYG